jgi:metal-responsive CopG/Arc/MetJ family transcriptional regulator
MRTIQMTLDDDIVESVDKIVRELGTTRSAFTREALRAAVKLHRVGQLEVRHRRGYERHPVESGEFSVWEEEQDWGDE